MTDTLRSICEQSIQLNNPPLDFIPAGSTRHKEIILRDLKELVSAAFAEQEKTVVVLAGSILEAVLHGFIQGQASYIAARRGAFQFNPELGLEDYKNIFNRWFSDVLPGVVLPDYVADYRNLIHINRELNSPLDICSRASREMLRILESLLNEFSQFASPS